MLFYENEFYQVHILQEGSDKALYNVVNKMTGVVEGKHEVLPNALSLSDAYSNALASFLTNAQGRFNPEVQNITHEEQSNVEDTDESNSAE